MKLSNTNPIETNYVTEGDRRTIVFDLTKGGAVYNLTGLKVTFHRYFTNKGVDDEIDTVDEAAQIAITDAANGEVTITPTASYWVLGTYWCHFEVLETGKNYRFPDTEVIAFVVTDELIGG